MDRLRNTVIVAVVGLLLLPGILAAETFWEGNAARIREGEIAERGLVAASNTFPRNTRIRVTNRSSGTSETLTVVQRIDRATNVMLLVSAEAATRLGIGSGEVVPVRVAIAGDQGIPVETGLTEPAFSRDPDVNPAVSAPPAALRPLISVPEQSAVQPEAAPGPGPVAVEPRSGPATPEGDAGVPGATAPQQAASTTPEPALVAATPTAPPTQPVTEPATPGTPASGTTEPPVRLPVTTAQQEEAFVAQMAEREPAKRVFAPARGPDVAELFLAQETPSVSPEPEPAQVSIAANGGLDRPGVGESAPTGPAVAPVEVTAGPARGPFVQVERPDREPVEVALDDLPSQTPEERGTQGFVQLTEPEAALTGPAAVPGSMSPFVQIEPPRTQTEQLAVAEPTPQAPLERGAPPPAEDTGPAFVQTERPDTSVAALSVAPTSPVAPPERTVGGAFVQTERPEAVVAAAPEGDGALPDAGAAAFVQVEPASIPRVAVVVEPTIPAVPLSRGIDGAIVQTEQPNPTRLADTGEVMSMVDSPTEGLTGAELPSAPTATRGDLRITPLSPIESATLVATLGAAGTEEAAGAITETEVRLTATEPVPPTDATGPAVVARTGPATGPQPIPAGTTPAALLAAAVTRRGLPVHAYYLQVAAVASERLAEDLQSRLDGNYPSWVIPPERADRTVFRVLVGPLTDDERGAVLHQFQVGGYRDAYLRFLN